MNEIGDCFGTSGYGYAIALGGTYEWAAEL
jgi:hypothetical protein